jgi:hypothetical protein
MSTPSQTTLNGSFEAFDKFEAFTGALEPAHGRGQRVAPSEAAAQQAKANPSSLVSLLAKTLGASRPDWRQHRHARTNYASSRVSYVEETMTPDQAREFD